MLKNTQTNKVQPFNFENPERRRGKKVVKPDDINSFAVYKDPFYLLPINIIHIKYKKEGLCLCLVPDA